MVKGVVGGWPGDYGYGCRLSEDQSFVFLRSFPLGGILFYRGKITMIGVRAAQTFKDNRIVRALLLIPM
jgi:hypothetical protein